MNTELSVEKIGDVLDAVKELGYTFGYVTDHSDKKGALLVYSFRKSLADYPKRDSSAVGALLSIIERHTLEDNLDDLFCCDVLSTFGIRGPYDFAVKHAND